MRPRELHPGPTSFARLRAVRGGVRGPYDPLASASGRFTEGFGDEVEGRKYPAFPLVNYSG